MQTVPRSNEILKKYFQRKQEKNPNFSLRLLANMLGISPAYLSRIMNGQKPVPAHLNQELVWRLEMDATAQEQLRRSILVDKQIDAEAMEIIQESIGAQLTERPSSEEFTEVPEKYLVLLEEWYYLPILDLTTCENFQPDAEWIAARLGLRVSVAAEAWARLIRLGCVALANGRWKKAEDKIRFPAHKSHPSVRKYHRNNLKKAAEQLTDDAAGDFSRRSIMGGCVSTNSESIEKAKKILDEAMFKAMQVLCEGEGEEIYHLAVQLFPLTKSESSEAYRQRSITVSP